MLDMGESKKKDMANKSWKTKGCHRGMKQLCSI
jgi:hypothetical protein